MSRNTLRWLFLAAFIAAASLLWLMRDRVIATALSFHSVAPETDLPAKSGEIRSLHPEPKAGEKIYTNEDIRKCNAQQELPARHPATYTNYDLKKYHQHAPASDLEKIRNELKWVNEPEQKKGARQTKTSP